MYLLFWYSVILEGSCGLPTFHAQDPYRMTECEHRCCIIIISLNQVE